MWQIFIGANEICDILIGLWYQIFHRTVCTTCEDRCRPGDFPWCEFQAQIYLRIFSYIPDTHVADLWYAQALRAYLNCILE